MQFVFRERSTADPRTFVREPWTPTGTHRTSTRPPFVDTHAAMEEEGACEERRRQVCGCAAYALLSAAAPQHVHEHVAMHAASSSSCASGLSCET